MVKIKDGYVMDHREQGEFDRVNALPRKTSGTVAYYFKPQTKYPPRIYVFMHAEIWCDRNRRPMGLFHALPFLKRRMNSEEIEYHHFNTRLCYYQYEDWGRLLYAEDKEAEQLELEQPGIGVAFLESLRSFQGKYPLGVSPLIVKPEIVEPPESDEMRYLRELIAKGAELNAGEIAELLDKEQEGEKRACILILLREIYKQAAGASNSLAKMTTAVIRRRAEVSAQRSRRNFVRRIYRCNPLFALEEIGQRYPGYDITMLITDLRRKTVKRKQVKKKPVLDLRRVQLRKLAEKLEQAGEDEHAYHEICTRIAILAEAHRNRCPIPLSVRLQGRTETYYFHWKTRETVIKAFAEYANTHGQTHEALQTRHNEITSSNYSF
ncbi:hypothetical protein ABDD95_12730 [Mucilaginibacter sp. PAMB04274]|uniref:hypothetical protein n=1 Tax=Mucilaginibacter sp. PAMB04274 TaxID=3138568 RepID=UPI0031F6D457